MHITHTFSAYHTIFLPLSFSLHSRRDCPCLFALDSSQQCFTHIWHYVDTIKTFELVNYDIIRELPCSLLHPLLQLVQGEKDASVLHSLVHLVECDILSWILFTRIHFILSHKKLGVGIVGALCCNEVYCTPCTHWWGSMWWRRNRKSIGCSRPQLQINILQTMGLFYSSRNHIWNPHLYTILQVKFEQQIMFCGLGVNQVLDLTVHSLTGYTNCDLECITIGAKTSQSTFERWLQSKYLSKQAPLSVKLIRFVSSQPST